MSLLVKVVAVSSMVIFFTACSSAPKVPSIPLIAQIPLVSPQAPVCKDENVTALSDQEILPQEIEEDLSQSIKRVNDLERFPQDISLYVDRNAIEQNTTFEIQKKFEGYHYRPWSYQTAPICVKEASWPISAFKTGYGSNLKPLSPLWFSEMEQQSNFKAFSTLNQYAITTKWMSLRVFPTAKPLYKNPAKPGDGYPFDMLQNSSVAFNEPIFISHYSQDGAWAYIFTNNASGWVESNGVIALSLDKIEILKSKEKLFITEDRVPLRDSENNFVAYSRIGMVLPFSSETNESMVALFVNSSGNIKEMYIPKQSVRLGIGQINKKDLIKVGTHLLRNTYGWGGMFEERDCSSMIRDYMTPFGIWLPRNSAQQATKGEVVSFKDLNNSRKITLIKEKGIPFETIVYKKGHVLLYVGTYNDNVMVMHNIWGIRTQDKEGVKGRVIIGRTVISTLELGADVENFDFNNMLLSTITSMNIFTKTPNTVVRKKSPEKFSKL